MSNSKRKSDISPTQSEREKKNKTSDNKKDGKGNDEDGCEDKDRDKKVIEKSIKTIPNKIDRDILSMKTIADDYIYFLHI